jgi:adenylate cyclase
MEIERKFLVVDVPPEAMSGPGVGLRQGYLAEDGDVEVRIRISDGGAVLTVKAGQGMVRTEVEVPLEAAAAETLWVHTEGRRIEKVRHRVPVEGAVADLDIYAGALDGLATVEVEFASEAEAHAFAPPPWFSAELTGDKRWGNAALAKHGRPD